MKCGCKVCEYREHPTALQFDHRNPKEKSFTIGKCYGSVSLKELINEVRKCDVLCANHHMIKTFVNKDHGNPNVVEFNPEVRIVRKFTKRKKDEKTF